MLKNNLVKDLKDLLKIFRRGGLHVYVSDHISQIAEMRTETCIEVKLPEYGKIEVYLHCKRMKTLYQRDYDLLVSLDGKGNRNPANVVSVNALETSVNTRSELTKLIQHYTEKQYRYLLLNPSTVTRFDLVMLELHQTIHDLEVIKHGIRAFHDDAVVKVVLDNRQGLFIMPSLTP